MVFCVLSTIVIGVCLLFANAEEEDVRAEAQELAENTGAWFSDQLDQAMMPLFSIAQFATELELFRDLPNQIGPASSGGGGGRNQVRVLHRSFCGMKLGAKVCPLPLERVVNPINWIETHIYVSFGCFLL